MSSDFKTVLVEQSQISDITDEEVFAVQAGAGASTYQQFASVSASNSSMVFSVTVPSENIVIDRHVLIQSTVNLTLTLSGVQPTEQCFQYGLTDSFQAFPLQSLFTTMQSTINNVSVSSNTKDIMPMLLRMNDKATLSRYNSLTPSNPDTQYGVYADGILANNNPLASFSNNGYDDQFMPRGAYPATIVIERYVNGVYVDDSPISTSATTNTWKIFITAQFTEPFLFLSPFLNTAPCCEAGLLGINNMSFNFTVDSGCKRVFSTANTNIAGGAITSYITGIELGLVGPTTITGKQNGFEEAKLLFNFLSLQPSSYNKIKTKNVVPYSDYPRYLSVSNNNATMTPNSTQTITSQAVQLNQVPDLIIVSARVPMSSQDWRHPSGFLAIENVSINFNNASGLLSSATVQDLYNISYRNGSAQSFYEFRGQSVNNNNATGGVTSIPTTGSLLVISPVHDLSLPDYLSSSSLGQYQLQMNVRVRNQLPYNVTPELCIITMNSGVFSTILGTSSVYTGILTKQMVLNTKEQNPVPALARDEYERMVGGRLSNRGMGALRKMIRLHRKMDGADMKAGVLSGGVSSGGVAPASKSRLSKHLM